MDKGSQISMLKSQLAEEVAKVKEAEEEAKRVKQAGQGVQHEVQSLQQQLRGGEKAKRDLEKRLSKLRQEQVNRDGLWGRGRVKDEARAKVAKVRVSVEAS